MQVQCGSGQLNNALKIAAGLIFGAASVLIVLLWTWLHLMTRLHLNDAKNIPNDTSADSNSDKDVEVTKVAGGAASECGPYKGALESSSSVDVLKVKTQGLEITSPLPPPPPLLLEGSNTVLEVMHSFVGNLLLWMDIDALLRSEAVFDCYFSIIPPTYPSTLSVGTCSGVEAHSSDFGAALGADQEALAEVTEEKTDWRYRPARPSLLGSLFPVVQIKSETQESGDKVGHQADSVSCMDIIEDGRNTIFSSHDSVKARESSQQDENSHASDTNSRKPSSMYKPSSIHRSSSIHRPSSIYGWDHRRHSRQNSFFAEYTRRYSVTSGEGVVSIVSDDETSASHLNLANCSVVVNSSDSDTYPPRPKSQGSKQDSEHGSTVEAPDVVVSVGESYRARLHSGVSFALRPSYVRRSGSVTSSDYADRTSTLRDKRGSDVHGLHPRATGMTASISESFDMRSYDVTGGRMTGWSDHHDVSMHESKNSVNVGVLSLRPVASISSGIIMTENDVRLSVGSDMSETSVMSDSDTSLRRYYPDSTIPLSPLVPKPLPSFGHFSNKQRSRSPLPNGSLPNSDLIKDPTLRRDDGVANVEKSFSGQFSEVRMFLRVMFGMGSISVLLCVIIVCVATPLYLCLKLTAPKTQHGWSIYTTHKHQYSWLLSAAFLRGQTPALLFTIFVIIVMGALTGCVLTLHNSMRAAYLREKIHLRQLANRIQADVTSDIGKAESTARSPQAAKKTQILDRLSSSEVIGRTEDSDSSDDEEKHNDTVMKDLFLEDSKIGSAIGSGCGSGIGSGVRNDGIPVQDHSKKSTFLSFFDSFFDSPSRATTSDGVDGGDDIEMRVTVTPSPLPSGGVSSVPDGYQSQDKVVLVVTDRDMEKSGVTQQRRTKLRNKTSLYGYYLIALVILINAVLVITMNSLYVALVEGASSDIQIVGQLTIAAFRIGWGKAVVPKLLSLIDSRASYSSSQKTWVLLLMTIFNSVLAPCLATIVTDRQCLYDSFFGTSEVQSSYSIAYCERVSPITLDCQRVNVLDVDSVYFPPVIYNYQCSSAILHNFVPVMLYTYSYVIFAAPISYMLLTQVSPYWMQSFYNTKFPWIVWPLEYGEHCTSLFKPELILAALHSNIAVLLTFGL